jgi:hypothetical protein
MPETAQCHSETGAIGTAQAEAAKALNPPRLLDARKSPLGRFRDQGLPGGREPCKKCRNPFAMVRATREDGIAEGHAGVAYQASPLRALDGTAPKDRAELFLVHRRQPLEAWQEERFLIGSIRNGRRRLPRLVFCALSENSWLELRSQCYRGSPIPRTDILTNVAAENVPAHGFAQGRWYRSAKFDRKVGDAQACVHHVGLDERSGRAGVNASGAGAAEIRGRQVGRA